MRKSIYELHKILGKYSAYETYRISDIDTCGEMIDFGTNHNFDGSFEANIYHYGELTDIELNGWTFGCHFRGEYHEPGTYCSTSFEIECLDPNDDEVKLYSTPYKIRFSKEEVLCNYLDMINIYSKFENSDIAIKFNYLSRTIDEGMYGGRGRIPMKITYGEILDIIKYFKNCYEKSKGEDPMLLIKIKDTVNGALDSLKKRLDLDKID
ncbi:MAG: hypothetical protein IJ804_07595 [Prevotella sp.]|nr:hypothetical protein [Prevotella sp.]